MKKRFAILGVLGCLASSGVAAAADPLGADVETLSRELRERARYGVISELESLIRRGADVNAPAAYGETALFYAIQFGRVKAANRLLELGANPNLVDDTDRSPLLKAAEDCNWRVVEQLLKKGAKINHKDFYGRTALINAAEGGCVRAVAVLLTQGRGKIQIDAMDANYRTAYEYARHPWILWMIEKAREGAAVPQEGQPPALY